MANKNKYSMRIDATNIGCHSILKANFSFSDRTIGIFASNGSGKTTISRMMRLFDNTTQQSDIKRTDLLISLGQESGTYNFSLDLLEEKVECAKVNLERNKSPHVINKSHYLFHVFNQDYVDENLAIKSYAFDSNIKGVIVGKESIDVSDLEERKRLQTEKLDLKKENVQGIILDSLNKLDSVPINKNTSEYKKINYENIYANVLFSETEKYDVLLAKYNIALEMPDNIQNLTTIRLFPSVKSLFDKLNACFEEAYSIGKIAKDFKDKVMSKDTFVRKGLEILEKDKGFCPFCEQVILDDARNLIDQYVDYFKDEETKVIETINNHISELRNVMSKLEEKHTEYLSISKGFNEYKKFIPSLMDSYFPDVEEPNIHENIDALINYAESKKQNIAHIFSAYADHEEKITMFIDSLNGNLELINSLITKFNNAKQKMNEEKLNLRRKLCDSMYFHTYESCEELIIEIKSIEEQIGDIDIQIKKKTDKFRANKKDKVAETFQEYLQLFFGEKYIFNPVTFSITFKENTFTTDIDSILSHGEKNILAFCHYLAATHKIVDNELDYNKLFFVIDDPVSSMDFYYVYAVAQVIKSLGRKFSENEVPIMILTHSLEFMSIIVRNNVVKQKYVLNDGTIKKLGDELIMPYEEHLRDINNVANRKSNPNHTTANSIRHVLETIWRFERPDLPHLGAYIDLSTNSIFENNAYLYSLIQDLSHGSIRTELSYLPEDIIEGCKCIVEFINDRYCGQITRVNR